MEAIPLKTLALIRAAFLDQATDCFFFLFLFYLKKILITKPFDFEDEQLLLYTPTHTTV